MQEVVMVMGFPASGKSSLSDGYIKQGYAHLNRDKVGGAVAKLIPEMERVLKAGQCAVLDNTHCKIEDRQPFIEKAKALGVPIRCEWMATSPEDCSINALHRMWDRYGKLFLHPSDFAEVKDQPNIFPITVIFKYAKEFVKPATGEGFASIKKVEFVRRPSSYSGRAAIFDYDDTLRKTVGGDYQFPSNPSQIEILPGRIERLKELKKAGFILLGASNQSGIARGQITKDQAEKCFVHTNRLLGVDIDYHYCPHNVPPVCYCRKPQSGLAVLLIEKYKLDPEKCIYVGDQTTDKTFAKRVGFEYRDQAEFFRG